jgi:hypothetical protein
MTTTVTPTENAADPAPRSPGSANLTGERQVLGPLMSVGAVGAHNAMTADQQDQIIYGYLRSHFAGTADQAQSTTIAARTTLALDEVERSLERLQHAGVIEAVIGQGSDTPTPVTAVR